MSRPKLLDLFCKAGGCSMGYYRAGFDVVGIDIEMQPHYPFEFLQADALTLDVGYLRQFDVIHASPPCQRYSVATPTAHKGRHPDLIDNVRKILKTTGKPYVIENVPGARHKLNNPIMLCGTMFGLPLWRHRYFEVPCIENFLTLTCNHSELPVLITGTTRRKKGGRFEFGISACREAAQIPWMTRTELDQAIPPAYTEYIGRKIIEVIP